MNGDRSSELARRAAKRAALADPARLTIVDLLSCGDASPGQVKARLGIASNLLAHHLKVHENQEKVSRRRSEGDRRRAYVRLVPDSRGRLMPRGASDPEVGWVVFVCTATSARSQLAAALWRRPSSVPVTSPGTHSAERLDRGALAAARRHGLPMRARRPRPIVEEVATDDMLVTGGNRAHEELSGIVTIHRSVPDPVPMRTDAAFDAAFEELTERVEALAANLTLRTHGLG